MSHLLYYWRSDNYLRDLDNGVGFHLNQSSSTLHQINIGESLWAFTRNHQGNYVLAAQLIIKAKTKNPPNYKYGSYRVWGSIKKSRYFDINQQLDISCLIKQFPLRTGKANTLLGQAFQGKAAVRQITDREHEILLNYAQNFSLEKRATLIPEDELEWLSIGESQTLVKQLLHNNHTISKERQRELLNSSRFTRKRKYRHQLLKQYKGRCQITGWDPRREYGKDLCEVHHIHWLSRGGNDELNNLVLISPNIHRMLHALDIPFDYEKQAFCLSSAILSLKLNDHSILPC